MLDWLTVVSLPMLASVALALVCAQSFLVRTNILATMSTYLRAARIAARFRSIWWQGSAYFERPENADEFRRLLIRSGPVFIKLGQIMCQRPDVFPAPFLKRLESLQRDAPQHSFAATRLELILALQVSRLSDAFERFERRPLASGSIAQVHEAIYQGRRVAVKVRHPGIVQRVRDDLELLRTIVELGRRANNHHCRVIDVDRVMREMLAQCDMRHERRCLETMAINFRDNPLIEFPEPLFATEAVLIETFVEGVDYARLGDPARDSFAYRDDAEREQARALCKQATLAAFMQMILHDALLHADMHRGNILYRVERSPVDGRLVPRVVLLDFGIVVHLNDVQIEAIHELIVGLYQLHCQTVIQALSRCAMQNNDLDNRRFRAFSDDCVRLVADVNQRRLADGGINIAGVMQELLVLLHRNRLLIDGNLIRVMVDFIMINEGRQNLDDDNLFDDTCKWVLHSTDGEHFAVIIDHMVQFGMADFNRKAKIAGRLQSSGDERGSQAISLRSMSAARQAKYAKVESLRGALSMRGQSLTEAGSSMGVQQRAKVSQRRKRRLAAQADTDDNKDDCAGENDRSSNVVSRIDSGAAKAQTVTV